MRRIENPIIWDFSTRSRMMGGCPVPSSVPSHVAVHMVWALPAAHGMEEVPTTISPIWVFGCRDGQIDKSFGGRAVFGEKRHSRAKRRKLEFADRQMLANAVIEDAGAF